MRFTLDAVGRDLSKPEAILKYAHTPIAMLAGEYSYTFAESLVSDYSLIDQIIT